MRTKVSLDQDLVSRARMVSGLDDIDALLRAALTAMIERDAARRLARLGGSEPNLRPLQRRRVRPLADG